jgi:DnaK suppressor protein
MAKDTEKEKRPILDADDEEDLTPEILKEMRKRLEEERTKVLSRLQSHVAGAVEDNDNLADEIDLASRHADQAYLLRLADKERKLLAEIDHALAKFDEGQYGLCEGTGEPIDVRRLRVRPWTRYSTVYKEQLEAAKRGRAR